MPRLLYENGMTKNSITVDPSGLLGESAYIKTLNELAREVPDDEACRARIAAHLTQDSSKRPQSAVVDVPNHMLSRFV